eukprot:1155853-Pelagomonas_calceolata.AAC.1
MGDLAGTLKYKGDRVEPSSFRPSDSWRKRALRSGQLHTGGFDVNRCEMRGVKELEDRTQVVLIQKKPTEQADEFDSEQPCTDFNSFSTSECGAIKIAQFLNVEKYKDVQVKKLHELLRDDEVRATVLEQQG